MSDPIHVLIVDDHAIVREGLRGLIESEQGLLLAGEAVDGVEAVEKARELKPDVILMDLMMPRKDGIEAIKDIKKENATVSILVLSSSSDDNKVFPAIKAGATGYMLKDSSPQSLVQAIYDIHIGKSSLHPTIAHKLVLELNRPIETIDNEDIELTDRELEVIKAIAEGLSNQEIAKKLYISETTVSFHISNILQKLNLANRVQAALYAIRRGWVTLEPDKS